MTSSRTRFVIYAALLILVQPVVGFGIDGYRQRLSFDAGFSNVSTPRQSKTQLHSFVNKIFRRNKERDGAPEEEKVPFVYSTSPDVSSKGKRKKSGKPTEEASICIVGGGVSGLAAAITAAKKKKADDKIILLEADKSDFGGRVASDQTDDGYILDRGFAVFIEEYPAAKELLDYDELKLGKFLPGALVKIEGRTRLAKVADPFRQPEELLTAALAPVGSLGDKIELLPVIFNVKSKSIEEIFEEAETDTLTALRDRWGFSDQILDRFFKPFLEGIYLAPLEEQSSRMFSFVFKMFSEGAATLPEGGIGAVARQLAQKARDAGVDLRLGQPVLEVAKNDGGFLVETMDGNTRIQSKTVILATDGEVCQNLMAKVGGFESLEDLPHQPMREVGCLYYAFEGKPPVEEPILILNGMGDKRGTEEFPVNNICFPSVVSKGYAPEGCSLCSVTVLKNAMEAYRGREDELDQTVRKQLGTWFPDIKADISDKWELKGIYDIANAQPGQLDGPFPANVSGGRPCTTYRGKDLPEGLFVCGDHMATATLNGALESGVNAGTEAIKAAK